MKTITKNTLIKKWYLEKYNDDLGEELNDTITFNDLFNSLDHHKEVYDFIGVGDSIIRERLFGGLCGVMDCDYDMIYDQWLHGGTVREYMDDRATKGKMKITVDQKKILKPEWDKTKKFIKETDKKLAKIARDEPEYGKQYSLTGTGKSIMNGNTWADSEVKGKECQICEAGMSKDIDKCPKCGYLQQ